MEEKLYYFSDGTQVTANEVINNLISKKVLHTIDNPKRLDYYIVQLAAQMKCSYKRAIKWLNTISKINKAAALNIMLKLVAKEMDKKYENHISESDKIFIISISNGQVVEINKNTVTSYENFAAFRTFKDAFAAKKICLPIIKTMFPDDKQKDN